MNQSCITLVGGQIGTKKRPKSNFDNSRGTQSVVRPKTN